MFRYNRIESNFKLVDQNTKKYEWIDRTWLGIDVLLLYRENFMPKITVWRKRTRQFEV